MSATPAQVEFASTLHDERGLDFDKDAFAALSVEDASATIDVLLNEVESGPITEDQSDQIAALLEVLGPRNDGQEWQIPTTQGRAAAFIRLLEKWVRGKQYGERKDEARERLGLPAAAPVGVPNDGHNEDEIPF